MRDDIMKAAEEAKKKELHDAKVSRVKERLEAIEIEKNQSQKAVAEHNKAIKDIMEAKTIADLPMPYRHFNSRVVS